MSARESRSGTPGGADLVGAAGPAGYDQLLALVKSRRTVRAFKDTAVPEELVEKMLELARWAPSGFNMQPAEFIVLTGLESRAAIKKIVDDWIESDFYQLEATRESWQGPPWTLENRGRVACPLAPVYIVIAGDTRRTLGLPMNARHETPKGDSIFETSLADVFMYLWLAAQSLGLGAQPVSSVKSARVQGLVRHLLNLPDYLYLYEMLVVGYPANEGPPSAKLMRHLDDVVHHGPLAEGDLVGDDELKKQIRKLRMGNVARHQEAAGGD
jgi:nitroreductase